MCGISGFYDPFRRSGPSEMESVTARMASTLEHRGPDDSGVWVDADAGIALSHRRLSILDLSAEGHQPMFSADGRLAIVFNGEIYNFAALRGELESLGHSFRGHSDTEIMLAAITQWGLEGAVGRFVGMFAFALWDRQERTLHLARDRMGEKPLYYGWVNGAFLFASELKALRAHPQWRGEVDRNALTLFLRHNYIPAPHSIYQGLCKLMPGTVLSLPAALARPGELPVPIPFWSMKSVAETGAANPFAGSESEAADELEKLLKKAIGQQMVADVPLGAFLSGGVDSSTIVALMQAQSSRPVKTFTIGFHETGYNEAEFARDVADHLGTDHTELYVTPEEAMGVIPRLPTIYDEPFSDASQIPTFLVSQLARRHVTVSLSGDAGDELFGGYPRYSLAQKIWSRIGRAPRVGRRALAALLRSVGVETWDSGLGWLARLSPESLGADRVGDRVHKLADILAVDSPEQIYRGLVSHWKEPERIVIGAKEPATALNDPSQWVPLPDFFQRMMYLDAITYLPDDILVKVDRASMAVSLESRIPLLDHRVVEFAWRLPLSMKVKNGRSKWLLREVLHRHVPRKLIERPKMGFGVPTDIWLRGPLRDWAEQLLDSKRLRDEGFFAPAPIRQKWEEHLSGRRNWQYYLWDILMFQGWLDSQKQGFL
jgi:asparagine synthase (glutamine-hydrolysing)